MAHTYTKADVSNTDNKDIPITETWKEDKSEAFTIRQLEERIASCDSVIASQNERKTKYQAKIAEAEKVIAG